MARRKSIKKIETSKCLTIIILIVALVDLQLSYILAFLDKPLNDTVSVAIVTEIITVCLGYFIKAFKSKKEEEKIKLRREEKDLSEGED